MNKPALGIFNSLSKIAACDESLGKESSDMSLSNLEVKQNLPLYKQQIEISENGTR